MTEVTVIGIDIDKTSFHLVALDATGAILARDGDGPRPPRPTNGASVRQAFGGLDLSDIHVKEADRQRLKAAASAYRPRCPTDGRYHAAGGPDVALTVLDAVSMAAPHRDSPTPPRGQASGSSVCSRNATTITSSASDKVVE
jgi:hypothetical protein